MVLPPTPGEEEASGVAGRGTTPSCRGGMPSDGKKQFFSDCVFFFEKKKQVFFLNCFFFIVFF